MEQDSVHSPQPQADPMQHPARRHELLRVGIYVVYISAALWVVFANSLHDISAVLYGNPHRGLQYLLTGDSLQVRVPLMIVAAFLASQTAGFLASPTGDRRQGATDGSVRGVVSRMLPGIAILFVMGCMLFAESFGVAGSDLDPDFRARLDVFEERLLARGVEVRMTAGRRSYEYQNRLYAQGRTTPGRKVTNARGGYSWHNFGLAADYVPLVNGKADWNGPWDVFGEVAEECGLEWGGNWENRHDRPHVQWTKGRALWQLRALEAVYDAPTVVGILLVVVLVFRFAVLLVAVRRKHRSGNGKRVIMRMLLPDTSLAVTRVVWVATAVSSLCLALFVGSYIRVTDDGLAVNSFRRIGEMRYGWDAVTEIEMLERTSATDNRTICCGYEIHLNDGSRLTMRSSPRQPDLGPAIRYIVLHARRATLDDW